MVAYVEYDDAAIAEWDDRVEKRGPDECWPWIGARLPKSGYGQFWPSGRAGGKVYAHRFAVMVFQGEPIPEGYEVDHVACDWTSCANPAHLAVVPIATNRRRRKGWGLVDGLWYCSAGHPMTSDNFNRALADPTCRPCFNVRRQAWRRDRVAAGLPAS